MSLLDLLLQEPSSSERMLGMLGMLQSSAPSTPGGGPAAPPGRGIFGNDQVDVLMPGDPRLVDRFGVTLARPAMRSLADVLQSIGYHGDAGGGYRTPAEQAALRASKPGLAAPEGSSFHQEGIAIDLASALQNAQTFAALRRAGWNQLEGEPWHWTYGAYG